MTTTPTSGAEDLASRLRTACTSVRSKSYPLADLIPLMQQAADALASAPAKPAAQQGVAYAALPESFLEIPDVQDESGINAYYSREVVLECIDAALWHWLAEYLVGTRTDLDDEIVASETVNDLRKLVEAARKQGEQQ